MRAAFTTFVTTEPFPIVMDDDLTVTVTDSDANGNIQIDVKKQKGESQVSDAQLSSYCISRIIAARQPLIKSAVYYIRSVIVAQDSDALPKTTH